MELIVIVFIIILLVSMFAIEKSLRNIEKQNKELLEIFKEMRDRRVKFLIITF